LARGVLVCRRVRVDSIDGVCLVGWIDSDSYRMGKVSWLVLTF